MKLARTNIKARPALTNENIYGLKALDTFTCHLRTARKTGISIQTNPCGNKEERHVVFLANVFLVFLALLIMSHPMLTAEPSPTWYAMQGIASYGCGESAKTHLECFLQ